MEASQNPLNKKVAHATKWSAMITALRKFVAPVTNMILARLLTPDAFGMIATVTMVISFTDLITDAGFQKYLVQHEFRDEVEQDQYITVAFWSNLAISFALWGAIFLFRHPLATAVGNPGLGNALAVACASVPLLSFSSIQTALFRRAFDYKSMFGVNIANVCVPFVITIPLAYFFRSYWALIIGTIAGNLLNAVLLTVKSSWKPHFFYRWAVLRNMLSFSIWSLVESICVWLTSNGDVFVVGKMLSNYHLGLYKTSRSNVAQIFDLVNASIAPVLFATLSRLQDDKAQFEEILYKFQRYAAILLLPISVGIWLYRDTVTLILLGAQWAEAANLVGMWGLTGGITILFAYFASEVYRAHGKPQISCLAQLLHFIPMIFVVLYGAGRSYEMLCVLRTWMRVQFILVHIVILKVYFHFSIGRIFREMLPAAGCTLVMTLAALALKRWGRGGLGWDIFSIGACAAVYLGACLCIPSTRRIVVSVSKSVLVPVWERVKALRFGQTKGGKCV